MDRAVLVTGIGAVTSLGHTASATWAGLRAGHSGAGRLSRFDPDSVELRSRIAGEIESLPDPASPVATTLEERAVGRYARLALHASREAVADAGLSVAEGSLPESDAGRDAATEGDRLTADPERVGTSIGTALGGQEAIETAVGGRPSPRSLLATLPNLAAGHVAATVGGRGPQRTPATACAAGLDAVWSGARDIAAGRADIVLAGGTEAPLTPVAMGSFDALRALSTRTDDPTAASRPFDADRDGFVLAEGAGMLVLEAADHAAVRDASALAAVTGGASRADAHHPTRPPADGAGLRRCVERALAAADRSPAAVDYVDTHGTGTPAGDRAEARALRSVFETVPPVTSLKGHLGHALGAAGAIEAAMLARSFATGTILPTCNYETPDPECDLPVVTDPRSAALDVALSTAAGFGGVNGALVLEAPP